MSSSLTLEQQIEKLRTGLRPGQTDLADWRGGKMAVAAVPGAGKSHSLAVAAAIAIARQNLHNRKQLLLVTYTRSAAASIKTKVREKLKELHLPQGGFSVQTLHGLALSIATRHPDYSELNLETSTLVIPTPSHRLIRATVEKWLNLEVALYHNLLEGINFDGEETERLRRQSVLRTEVLPSLAFMVIREAKSSGLSPEQVRELGQYNQDAYQILTVAAGLYATYEDIRRSRNFIDYDDMILGSLKVLEHPSIRRNWQKQIFAVFEDEAQDSSPLQEKLISLLAQDPETGETNLVRVGDPNQAINSTFTPADPVYFNWFCQTCQEQGNLATMDIAGRSSPKIIVAANTLLKWVYENWSSPDTPFRLQNIRPVAAEDPQAGANPPPTGKGVEIAYPPDVFATVEILEKRLVELLTANPEHNAAILVRENRQGRFLAEQLAHLPKTHPIRLYEVSEVERFSQIPEEMYRLLRFLDRPHSPDNLKAALEILEKRGLIPAQDLNALVSYPEQFLYPSPLDSEAKPEVKIARDCCCALLQSKLELPHYQLIAFLGMTLKYTPSELATAQKLASRLNQELVGNNSLKMQINALNELIATEKFEAIEDDNQEQYTRKGQVTIITMHKAKGLDWDYVFIPFLHEDTLPGNAWVPTSGKFLGEFTLAEVARAQLRTAVHYSYLHPDSSPPIPTPLKAWEEAKLLKKGEEYRLLYVAMTRAKRLLWLAAEKEGPFRWNQWRSDRPNTLQEKKPSPVLGVLGTILVEP
jgi:DNA helicase-2/ATP-dependent DNA helicase PcrA